MRFGKPLPVLTEATLGRVDEKRAAKMWDFIARERPIAEMLAMIQRHELRHARTHVATWWQYNDAGLLFGAGADVIGHAIQWGFECTKKALWKQIASAPDAPATFSWELGEGDDDP